ALMNEMTESSRGAGAAIIFETRARVIAKLMRDKPAYSIGFVDVGGWDTHVDQGSAQGALAANLTGLAGGLSVFAQDLRGLRQRGARARAARREGGQLRIHLSIERAAARGRAQHRWHQSESRGRGPCSEPAGGRSVGIDSRPPADCSLPALPDDCTPRKGKRSRSSPRFTITRSGRTECKTTPSAICWPSRKGAAGRSSTEISAVLDPAVIITPLTTSLNSLAALCGAASIGDRREEREGSADLASDPAAAAGDASTCGRVRRQI